MSYRSLEIWQDARVLVKSMHVMTLNELPKFEMYEDEMHDQLTSLGKKINRFLNSVEKQHMSVKEEPVEYIINK